MVSSSRPSKRIEPESTAVGAWRPMTASEVIDLPQPDSPTSAIVSPSRTVNETPSTSGTSP
ncbi:hypothetical protein J2W21_000184 [Sinomonas atrocyanea]|nr:hypothetical protein [Sinomonas atrocyanea]